MANMEVDFLKKIIEKLICKNIIKILKIYQDSIEHDRYIFKNYIDQTIYWEIEYLIRIIKEKRSEKIC